MGYSLGFWLESKQKNQRTEALKNTVELHINYWSIESQDKFHYLDIGVKLKLNDKDNLESINFFFPFNISLDDYMANLGEIICSTDYLLELIFNENLKSTIEGQNYKDVSFEGDNSILRVYKELDITNNDDTIRLIPNGNDTTSLIFSKKLIKTKENEQSVNIDHYFRFRLRLTPENVLKLSQNYAPQDRHILSRFEKMEVVDFRINELRDLPGSVCNVVNKDFTLKQIHFFLIRDINDELKLAHTDYKRCRLLEKKVWQDYLVFSDEKLELPQQMLIYHFSECKKKDDKYLHIERFNAFAKFSRLKITKSGIFIFALSVIILGSLGSLLANLLSFIFSKLNVIRVNLQNEFFIFIHKSPTILNIFTTIYLYTFITFIVLIAVLIYIFCRLEKKRSKNRKK